MHVLPSLVVAVIVVVTPGLDMALVTKYALLHGRRAAVTRHPMSPFRRGLVNNALNPKIAVFFTSLLPQFGHSLPALLWLTLYALAAARGRAALQHPRARAALDYVSGIVLVGLGVRLAFERR